MTQKEAIATLDEALDDYRMLLTMATLHDTEQERASYEACYAENMKRIGILRDMIMGI